MADRNVIKKIKDDISLLTDELTFIFNVPLEKAFIAAAFILSQPSLPAFSNIKDEENETIKKYYDHFKSISYTPNEMRRAYMESYLLSLREIENYKVNVTLELPLIYLRTIADMLIEPFSDYSHANVLNVSGNNGNLALSLALSEHINKDDLYVTVNTEDELRIASSLRDLCGMGYPIQTALPSPSFRCDLIISDPFLTSPEDILIFFEDYLEYLNDGGYIVTVLPTDYVRSRVFSDSLEDHSLVLLGLIEYPKDLLDGDVKFSIVIAEKKKEINKEFFHTVMPSIKDIDAHAKVINEIKEYIKEYLRSKEL